MMFKFNVSYCKGSVPNEVEFQKGKQRAGLSFQLSVACDTQVIHLIGWGVSIVWEILHRFMT